MLDRYSFDITIADIFIFSEIVIALTIAALLWFTKSVNRAANKFLALETIAAAIWLMRELGAGIHIERYLPHWDWFTLPVLLSIGPLIYFYIRAITNPLLRFTSRDLFNFIPVFFELTSHLVEMVQTIHTGSLIAATPVYLVLNPTFQLLSFISLMTYLILSKRLIDQYYGKSGAVQMDRSIIEFRWLQKLLITTACLWTAWFAYACIDYVSNRGQFELHYTLSFFFGLVTIITAATALLQQLEEKKTISIPAKDPPVPFELAEKAEWVKNEVETSRLFEDPELDLKTLSEKLNLHTHELSRIINTALKKTFNDFISEYRVLEVIRKMQDPGSDKMTLQGIAFDAGFNSKSSFNRIFKQMTGKSPQEYKVALKNERPPYKLRRVRPGRSLFLKAETTMKWVPLKVSHQFMFKSYLIIAWRNLLKARAHSALNIAGLAVGMTVTMLIGLWIRDELSYNKNFPNYDHIARVMQNQTFNGQVESWNNVPMPLAPVLRKNYESDFAYVVTAAHTGKRMVALGDTKMKVSGNYMDPGIAEMLSLKMLKGTRAGLSELNSIMLSASTANSFFGDADPLGKVLLLENKVNVKVTGVYEDIAGNNDFSDLHFIAPFQLMVKSQGLDTILKHPWGASWFQAYAQIADKADMNAVSIKIKEVKKNSIGAEADKNNSQILLHPMSRWHLYGEFKNGVNTGGRIIYVWLFGTISIFVLLLACINFMNLSTARSEKRAKEVGIRKAVGSLRFQLITQFFTESVLTAFVSLIVAMALLYFALPLFESVTGQRIALPFFSGMFWIVATGFTIITGLFAGAYPALYLSSFGVVKVLKGSFKAGRFAALPRQVLLVIQFTVSILMIVGTVVIYRQVQYARNRPVGYEMNRVVSINTGGIGKQFQAFRNDLLATGKIIEAAQSETGVANTFITNSGFKWKGKDPSMQEQFTTLGITTSFGKTVNWEIVDGRDFSDNFKSDSSGIIINETAAKYLGFEHPVGETLEWGKEDVHIIGVVKDMITQSPYQPVKQSFFYLRKGWLGTINARVNPMTPMPDALGVLKTLYEKYSTTEPFEYGFLDEEYAKNFATELRVGKLSTWFAVLAIFISCLGLFGMASFVAEQRTKEIGVRKVLGASIFNLWKLLSSGFILLVILSFIIATPIAWLFMNGWLQDFPYRAPLSWWIFAAAGAGALLVTLITISFQTIRAAIANPVKSLRTE